MLGQALETGQRLPAATTLIRERVIRNQVLTTSIEERLREKGSREASEPLTLELLKKPLFMQHVVASVALVVFVDNLDHALAVAKDLVGEVELTSFYELKERWDDRVALLA